MARFKELTITHAVVRAGRIRKCYRCGVGKIKKGDACLEVKVGLGVKGYCAGCAAQMVKRALLKLAETESALPS